jgi:hypothetical protein
LKAEIFSSTLKKLSSLIQRWRVSCTLKFSGLAPESPDFTQSEKYIPNGHKVYQINDGIHLQKQHHSSFAQQQSNCLLLFLVIGLKI